MVLPHTYSAGLLLMVVSMICWGSWANTLKMAGPWRFELFYFDYAIGVLLIAIVAALTFGSLGFDGFMFTDDLMHAGRRQIAFGVAAGMVFNLANMLLLGAVSVAGLAVAFPIGIGTTLVMALAWNYKIKPQGNPTLLLAGIAFIIAAVVAGALAFRAHAAPKTAAPTPVLKGITLSVVSGLLMGCFFPLAEFAKQTEAGLGPYAVGFVFALGIFFSTFVLSLYFMNLPVQGEALEVFDYFKGTWKQHALGLLGGLIWCAGMIANFVAASATEAVPAGPAASHAIGQGASLIGALWGLVVWKEFAGAKLLAKGLIVLALVLLAAGLGFAWVALL